MIKHTGTRLCVHGRATYLANHVCTVTAASERVHVPLLAVVRRDVVAHVRNEVEPAVGDVISWNRIGCCWLCLCVGLAIKSINYILCAYMMIYMINFCCCMNKEIVDKMRHIYLLHVSS